MQKELQNKINMILYKKLDRIQKIIRGQKVFSHIQASIMATIKENGLENESPYSEKSQKFIDEFVSFEIDEFIIDILNDLCLIKKGE